LWGVNVGLRRKAGISRSLRLLQDRKQRTLIFKHNPELKGRSKVFYYVQKKAWRMSKANKAYRFVGNMQPYVNVKSGKWAAFTRNKFFTDSFLRRVNSHKNFKLKIYIRRILRKQNSFTSNGLLRRWKLFNKSKHK